MGVSTCVRRSMRRTLALAAALALSACGDSSSAQKSDAGNVSTSDSGSDNDAGPSEDAGEDAGSSPCKGCSSQQGCFIARVTRSPDEINMPWRSWPEADGVGTLVVGVDETQRAVAINADFRRADASYDLTLCVTPGSYGLDCFLDDNENADSSRFESGDYLDTCQDDRSPPQMEVAAGTVRQVSIVLTGSCD